MQHPAVSSCNNRSDNQVQRRNKILLFTQTAGLIRPYSVFNAFRHSTGPKAELVTDQTAVTTATRQTRRHLLPEIH